MRTKTGSFKLSICFRDRKIKFVTQKTEYDWYINKLIATAKKRTGIKTTVRINYIQSDTQKNLLNQKLKYFFSPKKACDGYKIENNFPVMKPFQKRMCSVTTFKTLTLFIWVVNGYLFLNGQP